MISTSWASPSCHRKQIRHWSLIRMLCCPARSPRSASSRLFGGTRRSRRICALFSIRSFLRATCWISVGSLLDRSPRQTLSVSRERNERITETIVTRHVSNVKRTKPPQPEDNGAPSRFSLHTARFEPGGHPRVRMPWPPRWLKRSRGRKQVDSLVVLARNGSHHQRQSAILKPMPRRAPAAPISIFQLKVTLEEITPPICR